MLRHPIETLGDDELIARAIAAYCRWTDRVGLVPTQPSRSSSEVTTEGTIILRNVRGELARYRVGKRGLVRIASE
jgi:hypothetical protein